MKSKPALWLAVALSALLAAGLLGTGNQTDTATQEEKRIAEVLGAIDGAGRVEVALYYAQGGAQSAFSAQGTAPTGAVVVAQGAGDVGVRLQLIRAVRTLLGLPENAVDVFMMEDE